MTRVRLGSIFTLVAALALVLPPPAAAQAQNLTERGCGIAADMVLVARSLAMEKVERALAGRIMAQVYGGFSGTAAIEELRERILTMAYGRNEKPLDLARLVAEACVRTGGDQGAMFGAHVMRRSARPSLRV